MVKRTHVTLQRKGEPVTVASYTQTGTDEYGDPTFDETVTETHAIVQAATSQARMVNDAGGETADMDVVIYLPDDVPVNQAMPETPQPSVITRAADGRDYRVEAVMTEDNGITACMCIQGTDQADY